MRRHDFWWRRVTIFWLALVEADAGSLGSQVTILFTLAVVFQRHEAAFLGQGPA